MPRRPESSYGLNRELHFGQIHWELPNSVFFFVNPGMVELCFLFCTNQFFNAAMRACDLFYNTFMGSVFFGRHERNGEIHTIEAMTNAVTVS